MTATLADLAGLVGNGLADRFVKRAPVQRQRRYRTAADVAMALDPRWRMSKALALVNEALADLMLNPHLDALEITIPPQEGKSTLASRRFPECELEANPALRVAIVSYEQEMAVRWGREIKLDVALAGDKLDIPIRRDSTAAGRWQTPQGGGMYCVGVGGPLTGQPVDLLIIDDPVKDREQAESDKYRQAAWDWWESVALTRLAPGAKVLLIQTRWHQDDLAGRIQARPSPLRWRRISIPAIATADDVLGRWPGEELQSARGRAPGHFTNLQANMGAYAFSSVYQQQPTAAEGNFFRRAAFRYWRMGTRLADGTEAISLEGRVEALRDCWRFMTMDPAGSSKEAKNADWTVVSMWCVTASGDLVLLDRARERKLEHDHFALAAPLAERWGLCTVYVEKSYYAKTFITDAEQAGWPVAPVVADTDKLTRAIPASGRVHAGKVWFPADAAWLQDWEDEIATFPAGAHDDQVDTLSYAARILVSEWTAPRQQPRRPRQGSAIDQAHAAATGNGAHELDIMHMGF